MLSFVLMYCSLQECSIKGVLKLKHSVISLNFCTSVVVVEVSVGDVVVETTEAVDVEDSAIVVVVVVVSYQ